jgi:2-polyprenyl-6-hydroxyphenyl methylase/3-demethylubiquinone-9 3-methyltransferase
MLRRTLTGSNPLRWNHRTMRGMDVYHDLVDWLGGLPYEVATPDEVTLFCAERGLAPERVEPMSEGGCSRYLFTRISS